MEQQIVAILCRLCGIEEDEMEMDLDLFESGLLDSFGAVQLIVELEEVFSVSLKIETIPREKVATPEKIFAMVREALS